MLKLKGADVEAPSQTIIKNRGAFVHPQMHEASECFGLPLPSPKGGSVLPAVIRQHPLSGTQSLQFSGLFAQQHQPYNPDDGTGHCEHQEAVDVNLAGPARLGTLELCGWAIVTGRQGQCTIDSREALRGNIQQQT